MESVIAAVITYVLMLVAYYSHHAKKLHISIMSGVMVFDVLMPFYLYATRDWVTRLIDEGDIFSFLLWTHFGLLISLFVLYVLQILAGRRLAAGDQQPREEHRNIAKGILLVRALVIASGAMLIRPEQGV